jgi:hypothetical protein
MINDIFFPNEWSKYITNDIKIKKYGKIQETFEDMQIYLFVVNKSNIEEIIKNEDLKSKIINIEQTLTEILEIIGDTKKSMLIEIPIENYYINNKFVLFFYNDFREDIENIKNSINYIFKKYRMYHKTLIKNSDENIDSFFYGYVYVTIHSKIFRESKKILMPEIKKNKIGKYRILEY